MSPALVLREVRRHFGSLHAVDRVSIEVAPGERRAIIGPNGAGKTTLFNVVAGDLAASGGRVLLHGRDVTRMPPHKRCELGLARTFQRNNVFPGLTVAENVALPVRRRLGLGSEAVRSADGFGAVPEEVRVLLADLGLSDAAEQQADLLGYGEQRQLEIAIALASGPSVLLLDEPTAGMSAAETANMTSFLLGLPRRMTLLIIEHDMDVVFALADRITVLHQGQVLEDGEPATVRASPAVQEAYLGGGVHTPR